MRTPSRCLLLGALAAGLSCLGGCGAGLITGLASSSDSGGTPSPGVSIQGVDSVLPLVAAPATRYEIRVTNVRLVEAQNLRVLLRAELPDGRVVEQQQLDVRVAAEGVGSAVSFAVATDEIRAGLADPTAVDLDATLAVTRDGAPVGVPVAVTLARQPLAALATPFHAEQVTTVGSNGGAVFLEVRDLSPAGSVQVLVETVDRTDGSVVTRFANATVEFRLPANPEDPPPLPLVRADLPSNPFPERARILVRDSVRGESTPVSVYYAPEIAPLLRRGPTTGGTRVTLVGTALAPYRIGDARPDFSRVKLSFEKFKSDIGSEGGGDGDKRVVGLAPEDFLVEQSSFDSLVLNMPPSPDGRPGTVNILLTVEVDGEDGEAVTLESTARGNFLYAIDDPIFGPRGVVLGSLPVAVASIAIDNAPLQGFAPDLVALTEPGGVAYLQLLLAEQNGMFQPFRAPRRFGDPQVLAQYNPRDLVVGDFNADGIPDLFVVNAAFPGSGQMAEHLVVLGQPRPAPPFGGVHRIVAPAGSYRAHVANFRSAEYDDAFPDVLLVPDPTFVGGVPHVLYGLPPGADGGAQFSPPVMLPVPAGVGAPMRCEAFEVADLDRDGVLDLAFVSGTQMRLLVFPGAHTAPFATAVETLIPIDGYVPDPESPAVGLHACPPPQPDAGLARLALAVTLRGLPAPTPTSPSIAVLQPDPSVPFVFVTPSASSVTISPEPIGRTLVANLDEEATTDNSCEMVVAGRGDPVLLSLALLRYEGVSFRPIAGGIEAGAESPKQIRAMLFDRAVPSGLSGAANAVFLVHESEIDGGREKRISTRLLREASSEVGGNSELSLLLPDAGGGVSFQIRDMVVGTFQDGDNTNGVFDLALMSGEDFSPTSTIQLIRNDGYGGSPVVAASLATPGLLPGSLCLVPDPVTAAPNDGGSDALVMLTRTAELIYWHPDPGMPDEQQPITASLSLFDDQDQGLQAAVVDEDSQLLIGDLNGDGFDDLVVILSYVNPMPGPRDTRLAVLFGRVPDGDLLPFAPPLGWVALSTNVSGVALGDFCAPAGAGELAVAVREPTAGELVGEHVEFWRLDEQLQWRASFTANGPATLHVGERPTQLVAADFDGDGHSELVVAGATPELRLFRNTGWVDGVFDVVVNGFVESASSPVALPNGRPTLLRIADVDADGATDVVAFVERTELVGGSPALRTDVVTSFNVGGNDLSPLRFTSSTRIGTFDAALTGTLGDWNRDDVPDLFLGWDRPGGINLRVLFGGAR